jgi:hypothetical protein
LHTLPYRWGDKKMNGDYCAETHFIRAILKELARAADADNAFKMRRVKINTENHIHMLPGGLIE